MARITLLTLFLLGTFHLFSQSGAPKVAAKEENDPAAKTLLDKVRKKYEAFKSLEMDFSLQLEVPGQPTETQKGTFKSLGESKFRLDMTDQTIISDGKTTWIYLKKNNEVQITDADTKGEQSLISPKELMKIYQKGEYTYAIVGEEKLGEKTLTQIEFKPINKKSEYSKLRLAIDKKTKQVASIKAFAKDGGRYTFSVGKQAADKTFDDALFTFDKSKFPKDVKVEDLRM
jgi:outer membrane lipoprotein carrier protein